MSESSNKNSETYSVSQAAPPQRLRSLYVCYYPVTEPLVQTQVVAYLSGLAQRGHTIHLLSFETQTMSAAQKRHWRGRLKKQGIVWHSLRYHSRPTVPATAFDSLLGIATAVRIVRRYGLNCVHARSQVPAAMAMAVKRLSGASFIFDIRGLLAEEYEDAGSWKRASLPFRLVKAAQNRAIAKADGIVVLTERVKRVLFDSQYQPQPGPEAAIGRSPVQPRVGVPVQVIPCCADLSQIENQASEREELRRELGLQDKTVLVYVGKFGGWYLQREMVEFFAVAREVIPNLHFLILSQSDPELIRGEFESLDVPPDSWSLDQVPHNRVGAYLAASDIALSFIAAMPSKIASSPTKIGEYLAAGLPVVCNPGVGDVDLQLKDFDVGVIVPEWNEAAYRQAALDVQKLRLDNELAARCRDAAQQTVSLQNIGIARYDELYRTVAQARKD